MLRRRHLSKLAVRVGLPCALAISGIAILASGETQLGLILIGIGGFAVIVDAWARQSISSNDDRVREEEARRIYSETGRWPSTRRPR